jgi:MFS family permease
MTSAGPPVDLAAPGGRVAARLGGLPRPFWYLWAGTLVNRTGSFIAPFLALYLTGSRGFSVGQAGLVLSLLGLGSAVSQPVGGALADRIGRRRTMVIGLLSSALTLLVLGAADGLPAIAVAALTYGLCLDLFRPAVQAAVADLVADADRPRAFALQFWAINLGFAVATPLGGYLAGRGYWLLFVLDALASAGFALLILRGVPETRPVRGEHDDPGRFRDVLADRLLLSLVAGVVACAVVYLQAFSTLPIVFGLDGLGPGSYGLALSLNGVLIIVLQPLLLGVLGRRGRGPLLLVAMVLQGLGFGLTAFADDVRGHLLAIGVWTVGEVLQAGQLGALVASIAPAHLRGRYMGVFGLSFGLAAAVGPLLGTQVLERFGQDALWGGAFVLCCAAGVVLLRVSAAADRRASGAERVDG